MNILGFILYAAFVTWGSLRPMETAPLEPWDKVGHLVLYSIFALLGCRIIANQRQYFYLCLGIVTYSGLMEVAQSFLPGRVMSIYDFLANIAGVLLGAVMAKWLFRAQTI